MGKWCLNPTFIGTESFPVVEWTKECFVPRGDDERHGKLPVTKLDFSHQYRTVSIHEC